MIGKRGRKSCLLRGLGAVRGWGGRWKPGNGGWETEGGERQDQASSYLKRLNINGGCAAVRLQLSVL
jgi:hypothetical protein